MLQRFYSCFVFFFFFQAEDGIRDVAVTGVQTCALPIYEGLCQARRFRARTRAVELGVIRLLQLLAERAGPPAAVAPGADRSDRARAGRSEERRVGKECRSRWSPDH